MNRSKDLRDLFRESLKSKRITPIDYRGDGYHLRLASSVKSVKIYFYEWSNIFTAPRVFSDIESFDAYLKGCGIHMELCQRDIITNCGEAYASCYKGTRELNLKSSYAKLYESMNEHDKIKKEVEKNKKEMSPMYVGSKIKKPKMLEVEGRWAEDGGYGGYWY